MGKLKRFLEEVSVKYGYNGEINEEVVDIATALTQKLMNESKDLEQRMKDESFVQDEDIKHAQQLPDTSGNGSKPFGAGG